jgi:hypothetical protein
MPSSTSPHSLPIWVRALDLAGLALAALAVLVAAWGGFRLHVGGMRIGVTSPIPLVLWAAAVLAARHLAWPQQPLYREFPRRVVAWSRLRAVRTAVAAVAATRPAILFVGYLAVFMFGYAHGDAPLRFFKSELLNLPVRWDAGWYLQIASEGYRYTSTDPTVQQNIVFFPAYPMLVRVVGRILGGRLTSDVAAGMALSVLAFGGALVYLFLFAREFVDEEASEWTVWLVAAYPFAIFYSALYSESLFLLGAVAAFYHFSKQEYWRAGAWGLLVGLTRMNGAMLAAPLLILAMSPWLPKALVPRTRVPRPSAKAFAAAVAPCLGLAVFVLFLWTITGHPFAWLTAQLAWGRKYQGLAVLVADQYAVLANGGLSAYASTPGYDVLNVAGALFAIAALWPVGRRLGIAYALFIFLNIVPALTTGTLMSAGRFSSVVFPAFIWLAGATSRSQRIVCVVSFAALQAFNSALFHTWRPLF